MDREGDQKERERERERECVERERIESVEGAISQV
jgi:hypothetical protein